jgi:hypothetical protein
MIDPTASKDRTAHGRPGPGGELERPFITGRRFYARPTATLAPREFAKLGLQVLGKFTAETAIQVCTKPRALSGMDASIRVGPFLSVTTADQKQKDDE